MSVCSPCQRKERLSIWLLGNKQKKRESNKRWALRNKEKDKQVKRAWSLQNKGSENAKAAKYRAQKRKACPSWANLKMVKEIYMKCPDGFHVDHIVPLQGGNVCGLHVEANLQYLSASENVRKSKHFEGNP